MDNQEARASGYEVVALDNMLGPGMSGYGILESMGVLCAEFLQPTR